MAHPPEPLAPTDKILPTGLITATVLRPVKVSTFGTSRKPVCDFLLVNTNIHRTVSRTVSKISRIIGQIFAVDSAFLCLTRCTRSGKPLN